VKNDANYWCREQLASLQKVLFFVRYLHGSTSDTIHSSNLDVCSGQSQVPNTNRYERKRAVEVDSTSVLKKKRRGSRNIECSLWQAMPQVLLELALAWATLCLHWALFGENDLPANAINRDPGPRSTNDLPIPDAFQARPWRISEQPIDATACLRSTSISITVAFRHGNIWRCWQYDRHTEVACRFYSP